MLISYGNQIRSGKYELHSKFTSAANFISGDALAFVVDTKVGAGPLNIVVKETLPDSIHSLEICKDSFYLNGKRISFNDKVLYDSNIYVEVIDRNKFQCNIEHFENALIKYSCVKSLAFLIDPEREKEFTSSFEIALKKRLEEGIINMLDGNYRIGTEMIKGIGYGLTPSGDDFISGFLIAMNVCQKILKVDLSDIIDEIYHSAQSGNFFTNAFLSCAAKGQVSKKFSQFIQALCHSGKEEIIHSTQRLLANGSTSGSDQAIGFLVGIKRFYL